MAFIGQDRAEFDLKRQQAQAQFQLGQQMLKMLGGGQGQPAGKTTLAAPQVPPSGQGQKPPGSEWQTSMQPGSPNFVGPPAPQQAQQPDPRRQGPNGMTLNPATGLPMGWMPGQATAGFNGPMMDRAQQSVGTYNQSQGQALQNEQAGIQQQNQATQAAWDAQPHPYAGVSPVTPEQYAQFQQNNQAVGGDFQEQQAMRAGMKQYQNQQNIPGYMDALVREQQGPGLKALPVREPGYGMLPMPQMEQGRGSLQAPTSQQAISPQIPGAGMINDVYSLLQNGTDLQPQEAQQWMQAQTQMPQTAQHARYQQQVGQTPQAQSPSMQEYMSNQNARGPEQNLNFVSGEPNATPLPGPIMQWLYQLLVNPPREQPVQTSFNSIQDSFKPKGEKVKSWKPTL